jgi:hypothetical protein
LGSWLAESESGEPINPRRRSLRLIIRDISDCVVLGMAGEQLRSSDHFSLLFLLLPSPTFPPFFNFAVDQFLSL